MCEVEDEGRGVSSELLAGIRQVEEEAESASAEIGRGLSAVMRIVKKHGGFFELQSKLNQGTRAIIRLPVRGES
jgi:signal transduction histidine kinase